MGLYNSSTLSVEAILTTREGFSNKKLVVPQSTTLEADTAFLIKPVTNVDGKVHNETYLFTIDNTKIVSFGFANAPSQTKNVGKTYNCFL